MIKGETIDRSYAPIIHNVPRGLEKVIIKYRIPSNGKPAPTTLEGARAAVWQGEEFDDKDETPIIAALSPIARVITTPRTWFVGFGTLQRIESLQEAMADSLDPFGAALITLAEIGPLPHPTDALTIIRDNNPNFLR